MIYFDNAATTLKKPKIVGERILAALTEMGNSGRGAHQSSLTSARMIYTTRKQLAHLFNISQAKQIAFTANATESLNTAIFGLIQAGDHVITTVMEHNSVLRPLYKLAQNGVTLSIIPTNSLGVLDYQALEKEILPETKAIVITHGSNLTGNLVDLNKIGEIAKAYQLIFIVDASQTAGSIPIDVSQSGIDVLCFTGHKSLLGPQGVGGLYVKEHLAIQPLKMGGSGWDTYNQAQPQTMPGLLEAGTLNSHGIAGLSAALSYIETTGLKTIQNKEQGLMKYFYDEVKKIDGIIIYGDFSTFERCPIVSLNIKNFDSADISDQLYTDYQIATRSGGHCAPLMHQSLGTIEQGAVRFSFSHYNTLAEVKFGIQALKNISTKEDF